MDESYILNYHFSLQSMWQKGPILIKTYIIKSNELRESF